MNYMLIIISIPACKHIDAGIRWSPFWQTKRHFQIKICQENCFNFDLNVAGACF